MSTLVVRCDAGLRLGLGHLSRCLVLADAWAAGGGAAVFAMRGDDELGRDRVRAAGHTIESLAAGAEEPRHLVALATRVGAAWAAIDHYELDHVYLETLAAANLRTLAIDDLAAHPFPVDVLLNQNTDATTLAYQTRPDTRLLLGPQFALVREAYRRARPPCPSARAVEAIVVSFGGSDPEDRTAFVVGALARIERRLRIIVVLGAGYRGALPETVGPASDRIVVHRDLPDLVAPLQDAQLMIGAGGSTVWEACCLGVPMVLLPFTDNQRGIVTSLARLGAARDASGLEQGDLAALVDGITAEMAGAMARTAWELVDGNGAARVVEAMT